MNEQTPAKLSTVNCTLTHLKSRQSHAGFKGSRLLSFQNCSSFLFLVRFIVVVHRPELDVEDIRLQEPMRQILQHYRMYGCYKYTSLPRKGIPS